MQQAAKIRLMLILLLVVMPVSAQPVIIEMANVVTQSGGLEDCLAPVAINQIDGERRLLPAPGFQIESGVHIINGHAMLDNTKCHPLGSDLHIGRTPGYAVNFEVGKTYFIAYDRSSLNADEWTLVVWKIE